MQDLARVHAAQDDSVVEASTTVSLAYASEYGFGRTSGHAADSSASLVVVRGGPGAGTVGWLPGLPKEECWWPA